jgi:hypothetical protein
MLCYVLNIKKNLSSYPDLVNEWHPNLNGALTSEDVSYGRKKKICWLCCKGHSYEAFIFDRVRV